MAPASSFILGNWMRDNAYSGVIYIRSVDDRTGFAPWNPAAPYIPYAGAVTNATFIARYGHQPGGIKGDGTDPAQAGIDRNLFEKGTTEGERGLTASDRLRAAAMLPSNPFGLTNPAAWRPSVQDTMDCLYVRSKSHPDKAFFDGELTDWLKVLDEPVTQPAAPPPSPPAPPRPPIVKPPAVPPAPPPIAPPAPAQGLPPWSPAAQRAEELRAIAREALFGSPDLLEDLFDQAGALDRVAVNAVGVGWDSFKPLIVKLVKVSRLARRRLGDPRAIPKEDL